MATQDRRLDGDAARQPALNRTVSQGESAHRPAAGARALLKKREDEEMKADFHRNLTTSIGRIKVRYCARLGVGTKLYPSVVDRCDVSV